MFGTHVPVRTQVVLLELYTLAYTNTSPNTNRNPNPNVHKT